MSSPLLLFEFETCGKTPPFYSLKVLQQNESFIIWRNTTQEVEGNFFFLLVYYQINLGKTKE